MYKGVGLYTYSLDGYNRKLLRLGCLYFPGKASTAAKQKEERLNIYHGGFIFKMWIEKNQGKSGVLIPSWFINFTLNSKKIEITLKVGLCFSLL